MLFSFHWILKKKKSKLKKNTFVHKQGDSQKQKVLIKNVAPRDMMCCP